jgi:ABC-type long-subunit fatty acid transport system fused permease/ATPase subunit
MNSYQIAFLLILWVCSAVVSFLDVMGLISTRQTPVAVVVAMCETFCIMFGFFGVALAAFGFWNYLGALA